MIRRHPHGTFLGALLVLAALALPAHAQDDIRMRLWDPKPPVCILSHVTPGEPLVLPAPEVQPTIQDVYGPGVGEADLPRLARAAAGAPRAGIVNINVGSNVVFTVTYNDGSSEGFNDPVSGSDRRRAFEYALSKWAALIQGPATIDVKASFDPKGGSANTYVIASTAAGGFQRNFTNAPLTATFYPEALTEIITGNDHAGFDIVTAFNSDIDEDPNVAVGVQFYYGTDANPPGNDIDMATVAMHEIAHGLGFASSFQSDGSFGMGFPTKAPTIFDRRLQNGAGTKLVDLAESAFNVTSNNVFWGGLTGRWAWQTAAGQTGRPPIFAPSSWNEGSSMSHWDENSVAYWYEMETPFYSGPHADQDSLLVWTLGDLGYSLPKTRYAAYNAGAYRDGSRANPYLTVAGAAGNVPSGGTLRVLTGDYAETMVLSGPMEVRDYGGTAVIGAGAAPAAASAADRGAPRIEGDGARPAGRATKPPAPSATRSP